MWNICLINFIAIETCLVFSCDQCFWRSIGGSFFSRCWETLYFLTAFCAGLQQEAHSCSVKVHREGDKILNSVWTIAETSWEFGARHPFQDESLYQGEMPLTLSIEYSFSCRRPWGGGIPFVHHRSQVGSMGFSKERRISFNAPSIQPWPGTFSVLQWDDCVRACFIYVHDSIELYKATILYSYN